MNHTWEHLFFSIDYKENQDEYLYTDIYIWSYDSYSTPAGKQLHVTSSAQAITTLSLSITHLCHRLKQGQLFTHGPTPKSTEGPKPVLDLNTSFFQNNLWKLMWEINGKCITMLKETPEWKGRIGVTRMEGIILISVEIGIPLKTLSSGQGLGTSSIPPSTVNTSDHEKRRAISYQWLLNFSQNPRKKEKEVSIHRTPAFIPTGLCEGRYR